MSDKCIVFEGAASLYQTEALERYVYVWQTPLGGYAYVHTTCGEVYCLNTNHMQITTPKKLEYPSRVCAYCGRSAGTRDHLEPVTWTGSAARKFVVTVPACGECNSLIGDSFAPTVPQRRAIAHEGLKRKYKRVLRRVDYSPEELEEFEGSLRSAVEDGLAEKEYILACLSFPDIPDYDKRALERTGLTSAEVLELIAGTEADS